MKQTAQAKYSCLFILDLLFLFCSPPFFGKGSAMGSISSPSMAVKRLHAEIPNDDFVADQMPFS
jgi:hypothetical protein